jgi:deferrochelatase/peroxidase EfeB
MLNLADIQGTLLRGYTDPQVRFFLLRIDDADGARAFCQKLLPGSGAPLTITTALRWQEKPPCRLTLGMTSGGLKKLIGPDGYTTVQNKTAGDYFTPFDAGAEHRASQVGDVGISDPQNWWKNGGSRLLDPPSTSDLDLLIALYTQSPQDRERFSEALLGLIPHGVDGRPALVPAFVQDSDALPNPGFTEPARKIHFGYADGISQPRLQDSAGHDVIEPKEGDDRPGVPVTSFVMTRPEAYIHPLLENGSYAAFRLLYQDVAAFNTYINTQGMDPHLAAAKMCGRWLNGTPLVTAPDKPLEKPSERDLESFHYLPNDGGGQRCPYSAHIRRTNPRDDTFVRGNEFYPAPSSQQRRIIRRAGPYGPDYSESTRDAQRGLVGLFIGAKLREQFEFVMNTWVGQGGFRNGLPADVDPLFAPDALGSLHSFIRTDGALYVFLPGIAGLAQIAQGRVAPG